MKPYRCGGLFLAVVLCASAFAQNNNLTRAEVAAVKAKLVAVQKAIGEDPEGYAKESEDFDLPTEFSPASNGKYWPITSSVLMRFTDRAVKEGTANAELLLHKITVVSGKEAEYEHWVADQYMPAFRQTNPLGHTMARGVFGDSVQHYYYAQALAGWSDLDAPDRMIEVLGQRRYDQLFDALDGIVANHEIVILAVRGDLMAQ